MSYIYFNVAYSSVYTARGGRGRIVFSFREGDHYKIGFYEVSGASASDYIATLCFKNIFTVILLMCDDRSRHPFYFSSPSQPASPYQHVNVTRVDDLLNDVVKKLRSKQFQVAASE